MTDAADRKISTYSKGMAQRIGLAQALMNDPDLVVLDEPTDGVDPVGRRDIRDVLVQLRDEGKTVFVNSHLLSELEMICDRVAILVGGQVARQGTIDELTVAKQRYEFDLSATDGTSLIATTLPHTARRLFSPRPPPPGAARRRCSRRLKGTLPTGDWAELLGGQTLRVGITDPAGVQSLLDALPPRGADRPPRAAGSPVAGRPVRRDRRRQTATPPGRASTDDRPDHRHLRRRLPRAERQAALLGDADHLGDVHRGLCAGRRHAARHLGAEVGL